MLVIIFVFGSKFNRLKGMLLLPPVATRFIVTLEGCGVSSICMFVKFKMPKLSCGFFSLIVILNLAVPPGATIHLPVFGSVCVGSIISFLISQFKIAIAVTVIGFVVTDWPFVVMVAELLAMVPFGVTPPLNLTGISISTEELLPSEGACSATVTKLLFWPLAAVLAIDWGEIVISELFPTNSNSRGNWSVMLTVLPSPYNVMYNL